MLRILKQTLTGGIATNSYPTIVAEPPDGFRGKPVIDFARCTACDKCATACPTNAITIETRRDNNNVAAVEKILSLNYGDCIFCGECEVACPESIHLTKEFQLAVTDKAKLITRALYKSGNDGVYQFVKLLAEPPSPTESVEEIGIALKKKVRKLFGRSLHIREVDAGSCNGCEVEITALSNPVYDIERFGVHFVASPRHADMLLVTGPVTRNMEIALKQTYEATPDPKLVVAVGACAIGGGVFGKSYASCGGVDTVVPVDAYIPGCPPRPEALLHGILVAIDQYPQKNLPHTGFNHKAGGKDTR
jgi:Ni,Fe-hydrogenase III small subunit/formate hydrogenlyase subunit 6/NADH:ubiquinone oxidoreductase subunit I